MRRRTLAPPLRGRHSFRNYQDEYHGVPQDRDCRSARGESRSKYITHVLHAAVRARRDGEITQRLNELFADPAVTQTQRSTARLLDEAGTSWTDERW
jgi:hypothetical protein